MYLLTCIWGTDLLTLILFPHRFGFRTHEPEREKDSFGLRGQDLVSVWVSTTCAAHSVGLSLR